MTILDCNAKKLEKQRGKANYFWRQIWVHIPDSVPCRPWLQKNFPRSLASVTVMIRRQCPTCRASANIHKSLNVSRHYKSSTVFPSGGMGVGVDGWVVIRFAFWQGWQRTGSIQIRHLKPVSARLHWPQGVEQAQIKTRNRFQELSRGRLNSTIILKGMCGEWGRSYRWSQVSDLQVWEDGGARSPGWEKKWGRDVIMWK